LERFDLIVVGGPLAAEAAREGVRLGARVLLAVQPGVASRAVERASNLLPVVIRQGRHGPAYARRVLATIAAHDGRESKAVADGLPMFQATRIVQGHAVFTGERSLAIHGEEFRFEKLILALEEVEPASPITGLDDVGFQTVDDLLTTSEIPSRSAVIGAAPRGWELVQALHRLGSQVHWIPQDDELKGWQPETIDLISSCFHREGIVVHRDSKCVEARRAGSGKVVVLKNGSGRMAVLCDAIFLATQPRGAAERMALAIAGIGMREGRIVGDECLRTTNPRVFAIEDLPTGLPRSERDRLAAVVVRNALLSARLRHAVENVPICVMTDPQIAILGNPRAGNAVPDPTIETLMASDRDVAPGWVALEDPCQVMVQIERSSGRLVSACIVAADAANLMAPLAVLIQQRLPLRALAEMALPSSLGCRVLQHLARKSRKPTADRLPCIDSQAVQAA
jgi:pyruvate/2-oxoglutarate dehydrogenase complex dihydrolipoamide dehydrogenase (E3) component